MLFAAPMLIGGPSNETFSDFLVQMNDETVCTRRMLSADVDVRTAGHGRQIFPNGLTSSLVCVEPEEGSKVRAKTHTFFKSTLGSGTQCPEQ